MIAEHSYAIDRVYTLLARPGGYGYVLTSAKSRDSLAIVDVEWLQREIFRLVPRQDGRLVLAVTHNTAYYALGDATVCCSWGTHGVDTATGNSFVLASYLGGAPSVVTDADVAFMISLVPEGTQIPSGFPSYGGQFGSYLPIVHALSDILSFMDVQDYNTPPLEGLDGEIYQPGTVDYHAAMTELILHGFEVGRDAKSFFEPLPADKVAVGFLTGDTTPGIVSQAMDYLITGKAPAGVTYKLRKPSGYPSMIGAMFWTIDADRRGNYAFSNVIGPQLHAYPAAR